MFSGNWGAAFPGRWLDVSTRRPQHAVFGARSETVLRRGRIYSAAIDGFLWLIETDAGNYVFVASPTELKASKGLAWATYLIPADQFGGPGAAMDFPACLGAHFLSSRFNVMNGERGNAGVGRGCRWRTRGSRDGMALLLRARDVGPCDRSNQQATSATSPCSNPDDLRVYAWDEEASLVTTPTC